MKRNKRDVLAKRIVVGEGYIGVDPADRASIKLYNDFNGYKEVIHNVAFINTINTTKNKYRLVLELVK